MTLAEDMKVLESGTLALKFREPYKPFKATKNAQGDSQSFSASIDADVYREAQKLWGRAETPWKTPSDFARDAFAKHVQNMMVEFDQIENPTTARMYQYIEQLAALENEREHRIAQLKTVEGFGKLARELRAIDAPAQLAKELADRVRLIQAMERTSKLYGRRWQRALVRDREVQETIRWFEMKGLSDIKVVQVVKEWLARDEVERRTLAPLEAPEDIEEVK